MNNSNIKKEWENNKDFYFKILEERKDILNKCIQSNSEYLNLEQLYADINYALFRTDASYIQWTPEMKQKLNKLYPREIEYENRYENVKKRLTKFFKIYNSLNNTQNKFSSAVYQNKPIASTNIYNRPIEVAYGGTKKKTKNIK